ncbi:MAG: ATP-binding protein [Acidobacteriota bacterium]
MWRGPTSIVRPALLAVLSLCVSAASVRAQKLEVRILGLEEGLVSTSIRDLAQDERGRLVIATRAGISLFDGLGVTHAGLGEGLTFSDQAALGHDSAGRLVSVASRPPFPVYAQAGAAFEELTRPGEDLGLGEVLAFEVSWGETARGGETDRRLAIGTEGGVLIWDGIAWRLVDNDQRLPADSVTALAAWNGQLVVGTQRGLALIRGFGADRSLDDLMALAPSLDVRGLAAEGDLLWVVGRDWIGLLDDSGWLQRSSFLDLGLPTRATGPVKVVADGRGGLYLASEGVLRHVDARRRVEVLDASRGIDVGAVSALLLDREGSLWVGGDRGLAQLAPTVFSSLGRLEGLLDDAVISLLEQRDGTLLLGHRGGLSRLRAAGGSGLEIERVALDLSSADGRQIEQIRAAAEDGEGGLWLAADSKGLGRLGAGERRASWTRRGLEGDVTEVLRHSSGRLFVGTEKAVYERLDLADGSGSSAVSFRRLGPDRDLHVRRIVEAQDGSILLATASGLHRLEPGRERESWRTWTCRTPACQSTFGVAPDPSGGPWVATAGGLFRAPAGGEELVPATDPEVSEPVFFAWRHRQDLWLGVDDGVLRLRPDGGEIERLGVRHGLAGREVFRNAVLTSRDGTLWIGTSGGLSRFEPRFAVLRRPPRLRLLSLQAAGESFALDQPVELLSSPSDSLVVFEAVSLIERQELRFRSWLEGAQSGWQTPFVSGEQILRIPSLEPGTYRLHLQAALPGGEWSAPVTSASIKVHAEVWRRGWFIALIGLLATAALFSVLVVLLQRRHSRELVKEVGRRTAELEASEDRYRKTFRAIEDGVITTDEKGRVALLNPGAQAITAWRESEAVGRSVDDVLRLYQIPGDFGVLGGGGDAAAAEKREAAMGALAAGETAVALLTDTIRETMGPTRTALLEDKNGERRQVELTSAPILSEGSLSGMVFAFRDISDRQRIEAELARAQKLEAVGILAGGIAHDFNNLLTVLLGNLSLVRDSGRLNAEDQQLLSDGESALMRARELTHQLLTFSSGGAPIREAASIHEVIEDSASFVLSGSKVRCTLDLEADLSVVDIDAGQISQVLNNLLINASQAMPGGGEIRVVGRNVDRGPDPLGPGAFVRIDVIDTGTGIAPELLDRIFDPYFSTKEEGRGLGLASAYSIVKNHEGLLTVDSEPGRGTRFHLFLPVSSAALPLHDAGPDSSYQGFGRVLIMDDDPVVRRTSGAMLQRLGFEVSFAEDGRQAIDLYEQAMSDSRRFAIVMMDLTVPGGMGGQDAMNRLLSIDPRVRAVVYSGYSNDPVMANHLDYGFAGRLSKPFRLPELRRVFERILKEE